MKIITIKRTIQNSAIGGKIHIYCLDGSGDTRLVRKDGETVLGSKCCEIKAGEERTFNLDWDGGELFAVINADGKNKIVGSAQVENLAERLILEQKGKEELSNMPIFEFSERKKRAGLFSRLDGSTRAIIIIGVVFLLIGAMIGGIVLTNRLEKISKKPKTHNLEEISITIGESFKKMTPDNEHYASFYTEESCVLIDVYRFSNQPELEDISEIEYCEGIKQRNNGQESEVISEGGLTYFVYTSRDHLGDEHLFHFYVYKTDNAFWVVQFGSFLNRSNYWEESYHDWAKSVEFH